MPKDVPSTRRKLSREGLLLIKSFEGFRPRAVPRRDGVLTIGYGHTLSAREGVEISEQEAELLLMHDLIPTVDLIHSRIRRPLTQNQFDALVSFIFSIGAERFEKSGVLELIRKGRMAEASEALSCVPDRQQPPVDTLYRRRCAEKALFELRDKPTIMQLLLAPISRPGTIVPAPEEAPLGTTGVLRHETLNLAPQWSTPCRRRKPATDLGTIVLLAAVGVIIACAALVAFRHGSSVPIIETHGAAIATSLCSLGLLLLGGAVWMFAKTPKQSPKAKQA